MATQILVNNSSGEIKYGNTSLNPAPYDIAFEVYGTPDVSSNILNFKAVRDFQIQSSGHVGNCSSAPSSSTVFTVKKDGSSIGTITFATGQTSATASIAQTNVSSGNIITVVTPVNLNGLTSPYFTIVATYPIIS